MPGKIEEQNEVIDNQEQLVFDEDTIKNFKKILVVDDIMYVVKSISKILREAGYFVITAMTANEALTKFQKYTPDLITVDQKLPDMTGINLVKKIREIEKDKEKKAKIVFITAVYEKDEVKSILNLDIESYLLKPFKKSKLLETVQEILEN